MGLMVHTKWWKTLSTGLVVVVKDFPLLRNWMLFVVPDLWATNIALLGHTHSKIFPEEAVAVDIFSQNDNVMPFEMATVCGSRERGSEKKLVFPLKVALLLPEILSIGS